MAKIDLGDIFTVANHAVFKPGLGRVGTIQIVRKKHTRLAMTTPAVENRKYFSQIAHECSEEVKSLPEGEKVGRYLACIREKKEGKKFRK